MNILKPSEFSKNKIIKYVQERLWVQNRNYLQITVGGTGSGKSYSSLRMAESIDPNFNEGKIVLNPVEFLEKVKNHEFKKGDCVVFDEAGVSMSNKAFMTVQNRMMGAVMETFRQENFAVIFTTPALDGVDKSLRKLLHAYLYCKNINYKEKKVYAEWKRMQYNPIIKKWYYHSMYVKAGGKIPKPSFVFKLGLPSQHLQDAYEQKKAEYLDKVYSRSHKVVSNILEGGTKSGSTYGTKKVQILQMLEEGLKHNDIAKDVGVTLRYVKDLASGNY